LGFNEECRLSERHSFFISAEVGLKDESSLYCQPALCLHYSILISRCRNSARRCRSCARFDVEQLSIFGSVSRGESRPDSDLDVLVKFKTPEDFDRYMDLKFHLERLLNVRVDLVSDDAVRKEIRPFVDREAIDIS
jgi:predicted nucleotidyltransferase